jgi:EmrB/QacA subfamily drug resistance transporter
MSLFCHSSLPLFMIFQWFLCQTFSHKTIMEPELDTAPQETLPRGARVGIVFALIIAAYFLDVVDFSIVQVALPAIRDQFGIGLAASQWVIGAYGITLAGLLLISGRAGDLYGQKRIFIGGVAIFTVASLFGGLSPSFFILVLCRAVQGIGAAMSTVTALAILIDLFPEGKKRNRAFGVFVAVLSAGFAAGSVLGGVLTVFSGWRSVMFVNVPIGIATILLSIKYIFRTRDRSVRVELDLPGAITVTTGLVLLVFALTNIASYGIALFGVILPLVASIIILAVFVLIEMRTKNPLVPMSFLRRSSVITPNALGLVLASTLAGPSFMITVFLQQILKYSALVSGLGQLPGAVVFFFIGGWGAAWLVDKFGVRLVLISSTILIPAGIALLTLMTADGNYFQVLPGMVLWSLGASLAFPALSASAFSGIKTGEEGMASGFINTSFRIGFPLGLAILLTVTNQVDKMADPNTSPAEVIVGFRYAMIVAAVMAFAGIFLATRIKGPPGNQPKNQNPGV